ncbi:MAG: hypothetical protein AAF346_10950 [Pseudomonadota bacterium]
MSVGEPNIKVCLVGPFRIQDSGGADRTPRSQKARALVAILALSPNYERSRTWLKDKLWSDRQDAQALGSLRQSLKQIRTALGSEKGCLETDGQTVRLDPEAISVSFECEAEQGADPLSIASELLEDLNAKDPAFKAWLKEQRQRYRHQQTNKAGLDNGTGKEFRNSNGASPLAPRLYLTNTTWGERDETDALASVISDMMAKSIKELLAAEVIDERNAIASDVRDFANVEAGSLRLATEMAAVAGSRFLRISLTNLSDNSVVWTDTIADLSEVTDGGRSPDTLRRVNHIANNAASYLDHSKFNKRPDQLAHHFCQLGISHLFQLGRSNFETADEHFKKAYELHPRGVFLAWRAYLRLFMHAERQFECRQTMEEEAVVFAAKAMEIEPFNSIVNSLASHVQLTVKRSYAAAYELAEQSVRLNQANSLGWLSLGVAQCQLGKHEEGLKNSLFARDICGPAPYRFQVDGLCCIAATVAGNFDQATHLGETSHAHSPSFAPALRFLIALYSRQGRTELAYETFEKLRRIEPDFSFELLREDGYPAASLRRTSLLEALPSREH